MSASGQEVDRWSRLNPNFSRMPALTRLHITPVVGHGLAPLPEGKGQKSHRSPKRSITHADETATSRVSGRLLLLTDRRAVVKALFDVEVRCCSWRTLQVRGASMQLQPTAVGFAGDDLQLQLLNCIAAVGTTSSEHCWTMQSEGFGFSVTGTAVPLKFCVGSFVVF